MLFNTEEILTGDNQVILGHRTVRWLASILLVCLPSIGVCAGSITARQASSHIGEQATVCGMVAGTKYAERSKGSPTFINLDSPFPNQIFTALVWGRDRDHFSTPPESINGRICVSGQISVYHGVPEIIVSSPKQLSIDK